MNDLEKQLQENGHITFNGSLCYFQWGAKNKICEYTIN